MKQIVMLGTALETQGGISAVVSVYRDTGFLERHRVRYIATHRDGSNAAKLTTMGRAWWTFIGLLLRGRVGLVHVHTSSRASFWRKLLFFLPSFVAGVPVLLHLHGSEFAVFHDRECGPLRRWIVRRVFERCAVVLVLSAAWERWVRGMCAQPRVEVLFNPVEIPEPGIASPSGAELLFLGRIGQRKGAFDLIDAVAQIRDRVPGLHLCLGGDGDLDGARRRIAERGLEASVSIPGWVRGPAKQDLLRQAAVFVLPSYHEGLPMGLLEAMAAGVAVVSTPVGGIPEAVDDGVEGYLVKPGDVEMLGQRLQTLLQDPALRRRMGAAARVRAQRDFSVDAVLPALAAVYARFGFRP